jgi:hypothetical protein
MKGRDYCRVLTSQAAAGREEPQRKECPPLVGESRRPLDSGLCKMQNKAPLGIFEPQSRFTFTTHMMLHITSAVLSHYTNKFSPLWSQLAALGSILEDDGAFKCNAIWPPLCKHPLPCANPRFKY